MDPDTLSTTAPGIFAAGDIAFGPRLIISAVADGKRAAEGIDALPCAARSWKPKPKHVLITVLDHHEMTANYDEYSRLAVPVIPIDRRTGVAEVETGFTEEQARLEASRCLRCWINTIFEGNEAEGTECILCGGCVEVARKIASDWCRSRDSILRRTQRCAPGKRAPPTPGTLQHLEAGELGTTKAQSW